MLVMYFFAVLQKRNFCFSMKTHAVCTLASSRINHVMGVGAFELFIMWQGYVDVLHLIKNIIF